MCVNREAKHICVNLVYVTAKQMFFFRVFLIFLTFMKWDFASFSQLDGRFVDAKKLKVLVWGLPTNPGQVLMKGF